MPFTKFNPAAFETEPEYRDKLRKISETMSGAGGKTYADVLAAQYQREREAVTRERQEHLKKFGDYSPEQERLMEVTPEQEARMSRKGQTTLGAYEKEPRGLYTVYDEKGDYIDSFGFRSRAIEFAKEYVGRRPGSSAEVVNAGGTVLARFP